MICPFLTERRPQTTQPAGVECLRENCALFVKFEELTPPQKDCSITRIAKTLNSIAMMQLKQRS